MKYYFEKERIWVKVELTEIGYVENKISERTDQNWGNVKSKIKLNNEFEGGLNGL